MNDADIHRENAAAHRLAAQIAALITASQVSEATALLALAKLVGQTVVHLDHAKPAELLHAAFHAAQDEMVLRRTAQALQAAGLGALMPVQRA